MKMRMNPKTGAGIMVLLVAALFLMVGIVSSATGAPPGEASQGQWGGKHRQRHHRAILGIWQNQQAIEQLGITEEQVQQIRDADFASREKRLVLKSELDELRLQMDKAFSQDASDQETVRQLAEKVADVQGKMFVQKTEDRLNLETILTTDQFRKLESDYRYQQRGGPGNAKRSFDRRGRGGGRGGYGDGDCPRLR